MIPAPDYCEPVTGWRLWVVARDRGHARLVSPVCATVWPPRRELVAGCDTSRREFWRPWRRHATDHAAPGAACGCGLHAMRGPGYLATYVPPVVNGRTWRAVPRVVGSVALWGRVVEGTRGWRAARAYPGELWLPQLDSLGRPIGELEAIAFDLLDYGVRVHICDGLTPRDVIHELSCADGDEGRAAAA